MRDIGAAIRTQLLQDSALTAFVGDRVYAKIEPPPSYKSPAKNGPCVVFKVSGGPPGGMFSCTLLPNVTYLCYGASEAEAAAVYRALVDVLNGTAGDGMFATLSTLGQEIRNDVNWPTVFCTFDHILVNS